MSKKSGFNISKKEFPGLIRIKDENGNRVWHYKGVNHNSLRELDMSVNPGRYNMKFNVLPKDEQIASAEDVTNDLNPDADITVEVEKK